MKNFFYVTLDFSASILATIFSGYVFSILWGFFIVATFGVAALNIPSAIGVMLVAQYVTKQLSYALYVDNKSEEAMWFIRVAQFLKPAFFLAVGHVVNYFM